MSEAWKQLNLDGEGLQSIILKLAQQFKQRNKAYRSRFAANVPVDFRGHFVDDAL